MALGKSQEHYVQASDGRIVLAKNEPLLGGGWVYTHEDVTEQRCAAEGTGHVVSVLGDVAGAATQTRSSAEVVRDASEAVDHAVANLRLEVEDFLGKVAV